MTTYAENIIVHTDVPDDPLKIWYFVAAAIVLASAIFIFRPSPRRSTSSFILHVGVAFIIAVVVLYLFDTRLARHYDPAQAIIAPQGCSLENAGVVDYAPETHIVDHEAADGYSRISLDVSIACDDQDNLAALQALDGAIIPHNKQPVAVQP